METNAQKAPTVQKTGKNVIYLFLSMRIRRNRIDALIAAGIFANGSAVTVREIDA